MPKSKHSHYKVVDIIGSSEKSWEDAVKDVIATASKHLRDMRVAEVSDLDVKIEEGKIVAYRAKVRLSFKYEG